MDVFSRMMFGDAAKPTEEKEEEQQEEVSQVSQTNDEETINYMHIMDQIGSIMNSLDQIKPALKELAPMLSAIKRKSCEKPLSKSGFFLFCFRFSVRLAKLISFRHYRCK